jgi:flagellar assembly protein FliH
MNTSRIDLERFENDGANMQVESPDYRRGKADGLVHAETLSNAKIAQSVSEVSSILNDMAFGYQEARHHILERMQPLVSQISDKVLPDIAKVVFGTHLSEVINFELQRSASLPIQIAVAPDLFPTFEGLKDYDHCVFVSDPSLTDGQAIIQQKDVEVLMDLPSLILALQTALNGLESPERSIRNGQ